MTTQLIERPVDLKGRDSVTESEAIELLQGLIEASRGTEAQTASVRLAERFPESRRLQHWADALNPKGVVSRPGTGRDTSAEDRWLKEYAHQYPGCWQAVRGSNLLAADPSLDAVRARVGESGIPASEVVLWREWPSLEPR